MAAAIGQQQISHILNSFKQLGGNNFSFQARVQASLRGLERWLDSIKDARPRKVILCAPQPPALPPPRDLRAQPRVERTELI